MKGTSEMRYTKKKRKIMVDKDNKTVHTRIKKKD
jgi:hypothetical protein